MKTNKHIKKQVKKQNKIKTNYLGAENKSNNGQIFHFLIEMYNQNGFLY